VKSLDNLVLNKTYTLPDSQIYAKTYYWSPWSYSETNQIIGSITRTETNDTAELLQLNLKYVGKKGENDTLAWGTYLFKNDINYFENNKIEPNGEYANLRIALKEPLKVVKLDLSYDGVWKYQKNLSGKHELPAEIGKFKNLVDLNLRLQGLKQLPPEFSLLASLKNLDLSYNDFESFPVQIFSCQNLDSLDLQYARISNVPIGITQLTNLKKLILDYNWLNGFPLAVTCMSDLRELSLANGNIKVVPKEIGRLAKLEKLNLNNFWNYWGFRAC
jgi:hypothetical protein